MPKNKNLFKIIAKHYGVTEQEVYSEIQKMIEDAQNTNDETIKERWRRIPHKGELHTPEELISYLTQEVRKNPSDFT